MGLFTCSCPNPTTLASIPAFTCEENIGQIQKLAISRQQGATVPFATFEGATAGGADVLASWTALKGAGDDTTVIVTPFFDTFSITPTEKITRGGNDNTTLDGVERIVGATFAAGHGEFFNIPKDVRAALKQLNCEFVDIYLINEAGKIIGLNNTGTEFKGIPVQTFFVGDPGIEGKNTDNKTMFDFVLPYGWADNLQVVTPDDFDPRVNL